MLCTMDELGLDKQTKASYMSQLVFIRRQTKDLSIKNFIIFLLLKSYMKVCLSITSVNVLTLEETKGLWILGHVLPIKDLMKVQLLN